MLLTDRRRSGVFASFCCVFLSLTAAALAEAQGARDSQSLILNRNEYRIRAGEALVLDAPSESVQFMVSAKTREARTSDRQLGVLLNAGGDEVLLNIPLTMKPGEYAVTALFISVAGEERRGTFHISVEPFAAVPTGSSEPPVILLDGWEAFCPTASTDSSGYFGNLQAYLLGSPVFAPAVYYFENCEECPNTSDCPIEQLGSLLGTVLNSMQYTDGTPVLQADVIAHSMGGLIVRAYLSGQQTSGVFSPPVSTKIRKAVFIATPHFGAYQADGALADILYPVGVQTNELKPGSSFLFDLAKWNQRGDDLRGTDSLAIVGAAASFADLTNASDGVVGLTSASLDFAQPGKTRIVDYCHIPPSWFLGFAGLYTGCVQPGIAYVDSPSHLSYQLISSFLMDTAAWQNIGHAPAQDVNLSKWGGLVIGGLNSVDQFLTPASASFGTDALSDGAASYLFYNDFVAGTGNFALGPMTCGPFTEPVAYYTALRCKDAPYVNSVGPLLPGAATLVQAGSTITIVGGGFGSSQCSGCSVTASNPQSMTLQVSSWSDTSITAFLPASLSGISTITVLVPGGFDEINVMAASATANSAPSITSVSNAFGGGAVIAPNTWIAIKGANLAPTGDSRTWQASDFVNGQMPTQLDGVGVLVNGTPAYLYYISPTQINALTPPNAMQGPVQIEVTTDSGSMNVVFAAQAQAVSPSLFVFDSQGDVVAQHLSSYADIGPTNLYPGLTTPAQPGEQIIVYGNGFGSTSVPVVAGSETQSGSLPGTVQVQVGGVNAQLVYAGLAGPGLYQFNILLPSSLPNGEVPISISYAGQSTQAGTVIAVQQ